MTDERVPFPSQESEKSMDVVKSEARSPEESRILENFSGYGVVSVKEELFPDLSTMNDVTEGGGGGGGEDDNDDDDDRMDITSPSLQEANISTIDIKEESRINLPPPAFNSIEESKKPKLSAKELQSVQLDLLGNALKGNAEPQHSTVKQPDVSTSVMCDGSVHPPLRPEQTNKEANIAHEPECCEPIQIASHSKISQANSESSTSQEPQCLGPFVEQSSIKCPECSVVLSEYYQLLSHSCIAKHLSRESRKKKLKCYFCEKEYGTMSALKKHIKTYVEKTHVQCSICGMRLNREIAFKYHALTHTNQWPYRCHICGHGAKSQRYLELHKTIHTEKSWMCDVCGAMFHNQVRLNTHKIVHSERKYECDLCFAKFKGRCQLKRHKKNMHSVREKFQCEDCSSAFTSKQQLKYHKEMKHDDNSGGERFICSVCNKEFKRRFAFNRHMNKHTRKYDNVIYTCDICKRNCTSKFYLALHIAGHNGKRFSCSRCGMSFTQQGSVKRHMLKLHSNDK